MKRLNYFNNVYRKSKWRSLWSAGVRDRFGSQLGYCGNDSIASPLRSLYRRFMEFVDDYQSGAKPPHSKGCRLKAELQTPLLLLAILLLASPVFGQAKKFDVVVYGGAAGGVMAAVSAAREGMTVAVVEPSKHLGGMVTGGLSRTDYGKKEVIGGIALEFYQRAGKKYGREIEWLPEPHVAEAILNEMVQEAKTVTVFLQSRLKEKGGVKKQGTRVVEIKLENNSTFQAEIFMDASYEGDLMAQSGVEFTWGRESSAQYGESLAGV